MRSPLIKLISVSFIFLVIVFLGCKKNKEEDLIPSNPPTNQNNELTPYTVTYPYYFPPLTIPESNPLTMEGIQLGRSLYYDPILSNNGQSCSSCHNSNSAFTTYDSNALAHINLGWSTYYLWNGSISGTLEDIMRFEVEDFFQTDVAKVNKSIL